MQGQLPYDLVLLTAASYISSVHPLILLILFTIASKSLPPKQVAAATQLRVLQMLYWSGLDLMQAVARLQGRLSSQRKERTRKHTRSLQLGPDPPKLIGYPSVPLHHDSWRVFRGWMTAAEVNIAVVITAKRLSFIL